MKWLLTVILSLACVASARAAAYLAITNEIVNYSLTNWDGAFDTDRVFFGIGGDSIPLSLTDGGLVNISSTALEGILLNHSDWRHTNVAISGDILANTYPPATNVMGFRRPRVFLFSSPRNDAISFVNFPLNYYPSVEITNNLLVAAARRYGTKLLLAEFIPSGDDYHQMATNYNAKLNDWSARATNADVVKVVRQWDFYKDSMNDHIMASAQTYDGEHYSQLGQTNFCLIVRTQIVASLCHTSSTPAYADVYLAYTNPPAANNGDRVVIGAGTAAWASRLTVTNAVTFAGLGTNSTIIQDDGGGFTLEPVTLMTNRHARFTGFQFAGGSRAVDATAGMIIMNASNEEGQKARVDHCYFNMLSNSCFAINGTIGVIDHNFGIWKKQVGLAYHRMQNWNGGTWGDRSWTNLDSFGTANAMVYEDNIFTNTLPLNHVTGSDGDAGARLMFRYNVFGKMSLEYHGTESGNRFRGGRQMEVNHNIFRGNDANGGICLFRSGVHVVCSNDVSGYAGNNYPIGLENNRNDSAYIPFSTGNAERAGADGQNPWDVNVAGGPFATGTSASYTPGTVISSITVAGSPYAVDQYKSNSITRTSGKSISGITRSGSTVTVACTGHGFSSGHYVSVRGAVETGYNTTGIPITVTDADHFTYQTDFGAAPTSPATGTMYCFRGYYFSEIASNTANTIYFRTTSQAGGDITSDYLLRFTNDTFAIWQVSHALDQVGRMGGSLVSGDTPTRPGGWNDQTTSKCYFWENYREGGVAIGGDPTHLTIRTNEHYVNGVAKPGYTPLTYPHYLVSGESPAGGPSLPAAPSGLSASAVSDSQINLSWTDNASDETGFEVDRALDSGFTSSEVLTGGIAADALSYNSTGLSPVTTYYYRVRATNSVGQSSWTSTANSTTHASPSSAGNVGNRIRGVRVKR